MLLISDGRPTVGDSEPLRLETLASNWHGDGVSVTTMGVGVDYNEDLMTSLALAGGGNYYYVENPRQMATVFRRELRSFGRTVVRDVEVALAIPRHVAVREVYGYRHERCGDDIIIKMNSLASGQKRRLLVALDVPGAHASGAAVISIASGRLTYKNEMTDTAREVVIPPVKLAYTRDRALVQRSFRRPVIEKLEAVRNAELRNQVMARLDAGAATGASGLVERRLTAARKVQGSVGGLL
ncbi:MAG: Ca-activated chloride channel family protein [Myxococcota bacterium]